jgi:hyaluronan synthase
MGPRRLAAGTFALFLAAFVVILWSIGDRQWQVAWLIPLVAALKFALSSRDGRTDEQRALGLNVAVVVPVYNEDVAILKRTLLSLLAQTRAPKSVHVIDDGSPSDAGSQLAHRLGPSFERIGVTYRVTRRPSNRGKRDALAVGFRAANDADVYVCIDSDTQLTRDALAQLVSPLCDPRVTAVTGVVLPSNHNRNLLTRLMDLRYAGAFLFGRASFSAVGSVLCCSGAFSAFRGSVVRKHLPDFLSQRVRGRRVTIGDDRRLTNYCLLEGRAVLERRAVAETTVPERIGPYLRQQSRWNKSFLRESLWCVKHMPSRKPAFYLNMFELTMWLLFTALIIPGVTLAVFMGPQFLVRYVVASSLIAYVQAARYFDVSGVSPRRPLERAGTFLMAPAYTVVHLVLMVPLRFYSMVTISSTSWGTRRRPTPDRHTTAGLEGWSGPSQPGSAPNAGTPSPPTDAARLDEPVVTIPSAEPPLIAARLDETPPGRVEQRILARFEVLYRDLGESMRPRSERHEAVSTV